MAKKAIKMESEVVQEEPVSPEEMATAPAPDPGMVRASTMDLQSSVEEVLPMPMPTQAQSPEVATANYSHTPGKFSAVRWLVTIGEKVWAKHGQDEYGNPRRVPMMVEFRQALDNAAREFELKGQPDGAT